MANTIKINDLILKESAVAFENGSTLLAGSTKNYDSSYAMNGAKSGTDIRFKVPQRFEVTSGKTANIQNYEEQEVTLQRSTRQHVAFSLDTEELSVDKDGTLMGMGVEDIRAAGYALASKCERDGHSELAKNAFLFGGTAGSNANTWLTYGTAQAKLVKYGAIRDNNGEVILTPDSSAAIMAVLNAYQNPVDETSRQFVFGYIKKVAGFSFSESPDVYRHTNGTAAGTILVKGASQTGSTLIIDGMTSGQTITAGTKGKLSTVKSVNRVSGESTGEAFEFTVTESTTVNVSGEATITISPPITTSGAYKTITASPPNDEPVTFQGAASLEYAQSLCFKRNAVAFGTIDLKVPGINALVESRNVYNNLSMRLIKDYEFVNDDCRYRLDIEYGWKAIVPEFIQVIGQA